MCKIWTDLNSETIADQKQIPWKLIWSNSVVLSSQAYQACAYSKRRSSFQVLGHSGHYMQLEKYSHLKYQTLPSLGIIWSWDSSHQFSDQHTSCLRTFEYYFIGYISIRQNTARIQYHHDILLKRKKIWNYQHMMITQKFQ